jgi:ketosteroid isomerase-like protein
VCILIADPAKPELDPKAQFERLIAEFGAGWSAADTDRIVNVFSEQAAFQAMPFSDPIRGRDAIRDYWKDTPKRQAEISFVIGEIFVVGPWFSVEFKCTFRRRRTGDWVDTRGAIFCETEDDLISEMRMYWHRSVDR